MATFHGKNGVLKIGANTVAEVKSFEINETADVADDSSMGDAAHTHLAGMTDWSGSVSCWWDDTDTTGQEAMTVGASVTINFYPEGDASGDRQGAGTATIVSVGAQVDMGDIVAREFELKGNGAITWTDLA